MKKSSEDLDSREVRFEMRLTPKESAYMRREAKAHGLKVAEWVRIKLGFTKVKLARASG
jgi:predicted ATP-grasp superfamily ATP-dependent carboligase